MGLTNENKIVTIGGLETFANFIDALYSKQEDVEELQTEVESNSLVTSAALTDLDSRFQGLSENMEASKPESLDVIEISQIWLNV